MIGLTQSHKDFLLCFVLEIVLDFMFHIKVCDMFWGILSGVLYGFMYFCFSVSILIKKTATELPLSLIFVNNVRSVAMSYKCHICEALL
jgi:hypothetical protein